jgi:leader peptidase (prepilin peptidase) / N-methyltransferase
VLIRLSDVPPYLLRTYAVLLGLFFGSFLNVVIYRVPRGLSIVRPGSHCTACGAPIRWFDNVPVVSYLVLRGRARCCKKRFSPRYAVVEAALGLLSWAIVEAIVLHLPSQTSLLYASAVFAIDLALALALVAVAFIDLEHLYVPDAITIGGAIAGVLTSSLRDLSFVDALVGAAVGFAIVWLPFTVLYRLVRGRTGMGLGDAKLVMLAGAFFGWGGALFALLAGAVQGTVAAAVLLLVRGRIDEPRAIVKEKEEALREIDALPESERQAAKAELLRDPIYEPDAPGVGLSRIAFGPFLALSMLEYLLFGREMLRGYVGWIVGVY